MPPFVPSHADSKALQSSLRSRRSAVSMHTTTSVKRVKNAPRSRNGCWTCRNRKVKCDEAQPKCTPCRRLGVVCDYTRQLSYKDDTPKILSKMAKLIDTAGCPVYDPTAKQIFHPYHPHLQQDYEEKHDNGFVVHCVGDYVDSSSSSSTGDSNMSRAHCLGFRASVGSDNDEDEDEDNEDNQKYYHKSRMSRTVQQDLTSHNVARSLSHRRPRLIGADTGQVNFAFDICVSTTPGGPHQPQFPPPDLGVSDSTLRTERLNESSPSLSEANGATCCYYSSEQSQEHSLDQQSSYSHQAITPDSSSSSSTRSRLSMSPPSHHDTYHEDSTISIASEPEENMRPSGAPAQCSVSGSIPAIQVRARRLFWTSRGRGQGLALLSVPMLLKNRQRNNNCEHYIQERAAQLVPADLPRRVSGQPAGVPVSFRLPSELLDLDDWQLFHKNVLTESYYGSDIL